MSGVKPQDPMLEEEVQYRLRLGQTRITMRDWDRMIRQYGYRFDRDMDCRAPSTYLTGERAGRSYLNLALRPVQIDDGKGFCNVEARRDENFKSLMSTRESYFAVVRGAVAEW